MGCIRSTSTGISLSLDEIDHAADSNDIEYIRQHLDNIDRSVVLLYSQILIPSELMLYSSEVKSTKTDIQKLVSDICMGLSQAAAGTLNLFIDGAENIYADIRPETLRIIISDFVSKAHRAGNVSNLSVITEHSEGKLRISIQAGGPHIKEKPVSLLDNGHYIERNGENDISAALIDAFCARFGGKCFRKNSGGTHVFGLVLPVSESVPDDTKQSRISAALNERVNSSFNRFSPEHALSAFKYKTYRYSEEL